MITDDLLKQVEDSCRTVVIADTNTGHKTRFAVDETVYDHLKSN
jgi:hypothetical protein